MSQELVEKIHRGIDDFNRRDFDRALAALADDVIWGPFVARAETSLPLRGKEQFGLLGRVRWRRSISGSNPWNSFRSATPRWWCRRAR
jgi:hypothetical protein